MITDNSGAIFCIYFCPRICTRLTRTLMVNLLYLQEAQVQFEPQLQSTQVQFALPHLGLFDFGANVPWNSECSTSNVFASLENPY